MPAALPAPPQAVRDGKVIVHFRHTGSAPILKNQKFKVPADARFSTVITLLRSHLRLSNDDPLVRPHCRSARQALSDSSVCTRANWHSFSTATALSHRRRMSLSPMWRRASMLMAFSSSTTARRLRGDSSAMLYWTPAWLEARRRRCLSFKEVFSTKMGFTRARPRARALSLYSSPHARRL